MFFRSVGNLQRSCSKRTTADRDKRILYTNAFLCIFFFLVWIIVGYTLDSGAWDDRIWHLDMMGNPGMKKQRVNGTVRIVEKTTENRKTSFCENKGGSLNRNSFMAEPANALSNYAFCVYGFITIACGMQDLANGTEGRSYKYVLVDVPWWSFLLGISQLFMGVGSFVYHAGITRLGQTLDVAGIYIILFNLVVCMLARFIHDVERWGTKLVLVAHVILLSIALISDVLFCLYKWNLELFARHDRIYFLFIGPHRCPQVYNEKVCLYTFCYRQYCFAGTWLLGVDW